MCQQRQVSRSSTFSEAGHGRYDTGEKTPETLNSRPSTSQLGLLLFYPQFIGDLKSPENKDKGLCFYWFTVQLWTNWFV